MENINLAAYYDKISDIRAKILSKHKEPTAGSMTKYDRDDISKGNTNQYQDIKRPTFVEQIRRPLQSRAENETHVTDRLKELDSVNQKIRKMLANKRQPSLNAQRNTKSYGKTNEIQSTPKKITSLFQNQNKILQSKVAPPLANWVSNKDRNSLYKQPNLNCTIESRLYTNEENNQFLQKRNKKQGNQKYDKFDFSFDKVGSYEGKYSTQFKIEPLSVNKKLRQDVKSKLNNESAKTTKLTLNSENILSYQQPKKSIVVNGFYGKAQTKRLVQLMSRQIELDSVLREQKQKFDAFYGQQKLKKLEDQIRNQGVVISSSQIELWTKLSPEECNPFLEKRNQQSFSFAEFANRIIQSQAHWNKQLKQSVSIAKLENQGFSIKEIDLGEKGYLTIQDFVCFINLNSDSCLRNRDVFSMFHRWNRQECSQKFQNKLKYEIFLNFVSK